MVNMVLKKGLMRKFTTNITISLLNKYTSLTHMED